MGAAAVRGVGRVGLCAAGDGLAGIGLYGALSYSVSQRRRELGVRAALGATRGALVRLVLREGVSVTLAGVGLGMVAAGLLTRLMTRLLFGTSPLDALSFSLGPALLVVVGIAPPSFPRCAPRRSIPRGSCGENELSFRLTRPRAESAIEAIAIGQCIDQRDRGVHAARIWLTAPLLLAASPLGGGGGGGGGGGVV